MTMPSNFDEITMLCGGGWVIISIADDGDGRYIVEVKNEGDVNQYSSYPDETATLSVTRTEADELSRPMEGFWGILKRERYYGRRFTSKEELVQTIESYITYYNTGRVQRGLGILTPMEKHALSMSEAA